MKNKRKPYYDWDVETGTATCILFDKNNIFMGTATCHPDDIYFMSEKTGMIIAETRAVIKSLQHLKNNILKPELAGLNQFYYSINHSKHFNKKSYEAKMLWRQIKIKEGEIKETENIISQEREFLRDFIKDKDNFYKSVKKNREVNNK